MSAADAAVPDATALDSPYIGLSFYTEDNAAMFFGRDAERTVLIGNLRASRLTLLYAQSGTGKSSLLRAGVASRLGELAQRSLAERGTARNIPVVFSSWRDDPTGELIAGIQQTIAPFLPEASPVELPDERLEEAVEAASRAADATLLVILDQFEEYFLYRVREPRDGRFADELAACINRADLRANFLISIREDAYAGLGDLFKSRIDNVYGNYLHLENLNSESARQAIEKPIARFNELHQQQGPAGIEPTLVDAVLGQLRPDQFAPGRAVKGKLGGANGAGRHGDEIAAPYLQLVMKRLWETERGRGSSKLRLATLNELGGAETIVRTHLDRALSGLPPDDREAAADMFHHLVTPSGTKIALAASDLAEYTSCSDSEANALLERLARSDTRILRPIPPAPGGDGGTRFEISHDLLAPAILAWGSRQKAARLEDEKQAAEQRAHIEKRRARIFRALAIGSLALLAVAIALVVVALWQQDTARRARHDAESRSLAASAENVSSQDPELATLLALRALHLSRTQEAEKALRDALPQQQLRATLAPPPPQRSAAFSADGKRILAAAADGTIRIWDSASHKQLATYPPVSGPLNSAALSLDGAQIVTANEDGNARIWDARSGKRTGVLTPPGGYPLSGAAFSPDGRLIVTTGADGTSRIWDARSDRQLARPLSEPGRKLLGAAFSPDGKRVVTASSSGNALIWDSKTGAQLGVLPGSIALSSASFSLDGKRVVTASANGTVRIWDANSGKQVGALTLAGNQRSVFSGAFSPDGRQLVTAGGDGTARIWDATSDKLVRVLGRPGHDTLVAAAFSPNGKLVVTASAGGLVRVWDTAGGKQIALLPAGEGANRLRSAALSPDGTLAVTSSQFGTVTIWKAPASKPRTPAWKPLDVISLPAGDAANGVVAFSRDGNLLATVSQSGRVYLWHVPSGLPAGEVSAGAWLNRVEFDPVNPKLIVTAAADGFARIFNVVTGQPVSRRFGSGLHGAAFSPDGRLIVTASSDGARIWNAADQKQIGDKFGTELGRLELSSAAFNDNGTKIVITGGGFAGIYDYDATKGPPQAITFYSFISEPGIFRDAAFSADGRLVTAGTGGTARVWDVSNRSEVLAFAGHSGPIQTVAFGGHGTEVITASSDGTAKLWDAAPVEQRAPLPGTDAVYTATFSPTNPRIVATLSSDGTVRVWNTNGRTRPNVLREPSGTGYGSAEFSHDGQLLVTTGGNQQARIWSLSNLKHPPVVLDVSKHPTCSNPASPTAHYLTSATFSSDGRRVVTADADGTACIWDVRSREPVGKFSEPAGASRGRGSGLSQAVFSPDDKRVLTASGDGTARIWDVSSAAGAGRQLQFVSEPANEAVSKAWFSPNGNLIVTSSWDGTARVWNATTGSQLNVLSDEPAHSPVYNAAFSPDGRLVVTCSDTAAYIWSAATGEQLTKLQYGNSRFDCEFSPDGSEVVTAGLDGQTQIFSTELAGGLKEIERIAEQRVTRQLTPAERKTYLAGIS